MLGLHFTLQLAILAAIGGIYWQLSDVSERLTRVETKLAYTLPAHGFGDVENSNGVDEVALSARG